MIQTVGLILNLSGIAPTVGEWKEKKNKEKNPTPFARLMTSCLVSLPSKAFAAIIAMARTHTHCYMDLYFLVGGGWW